MKRVLTTWALVIVSLIAVNLWRLGLGIHAIPLVIVVLLSSIAVFCIPLSVVFGLSALVERFAPWLVAIVPFGLRSSLRLGFAFALSVLFARYVGAVGVVRARDGAFDAKVSSVMNRASYLSCVTFHFMKPRRGDIVRSEPEPAAQNTGEDPTRAGLRIKGSDAQLRRVVAMPGEHVSIDGAHIEIAGRQLAEPCLTGERPQFKANFDLGAREYLVARDNRGIPKDSKDDTFLIVNENQILSRELFTLWPPQTFGPRPQIEYNIPDPPETKFDPQSPALKRFVYM